MKRFDLRAQVERLRDARRHPQISTASVWLSVFVMFVARWRSLNALEQELRRPRYLESWVGPRKASADTLARVLTTLSPVELREMLAAMSRKAWRSKAIHQRGGQRCRVVAIDGHELWASTSRCCAQCLTREVKAGEKTAVQYYHRVVVAQWVGVTPPGILDVELVRPGEGEVVAARRLLARILAAYGRLIDVVCGDALYLEAPFCRMVWEAGKDFVVVMKQEARELYQDADGLRQVIAPAVVREVAATTQLWDLPDLESFTTLGIPVRVVWAESQTTKTKVVGGKRTTVVEASTWVWVTTLPSSAVGPRVVARWGHDRWDLENRGFNELASSWGMDHCFVHDPNAIIVLLLTLAIAFLTTYLFYERNLKPAARRHLSRLALAARLLEDLVILRGAPAWPPPEPSG